MSLRGFLVATAVVTVAATGCGSASGSHSTLKVDDAVGAAGAAAAAHHTGKSVVPDSPDLKLVVSPTSGAPGTTVRLQATGCVDPSGLNHALTYNASAGRADGRSPHAIHAIASTLTGTALTASYTISKGDRGAAKGVFYVQCGATVVNAPFSVTR